MPSSSRAAARAIAPTVLAARGPAFRWGGVAAAVSWAATVAASLAAWVAAPESTAAWTSAWGVGSAVWFLGHGCPVRAGSTDVTLAPLLLFAFVAGSAIWGLRRAVRDLPVDLRSTRGELVAGVRREVIDIGLAAIGGYAAVAVLALLTTLAGPVRPHPVLGLVAPLGMALGALVVAVALDYPDGWLGAIPALGRRWRAAPDWVRLGPVLATTVATRLVATVLLFVLVVIGVGGARVDEVAAALDPGPVGAIVLAVTEVLVLPNLGTWALAWMTGPGFSLGAGTSVTVTSANPGLQPLLPVLGALPSGGAMPEWAVGAVLIPVLLGVLLGRSAERRVPRLPAFGATVLAAFLVALAAGFVTALGSGSLGVDRFRFVGPQAGPVALWLCLELCLGGALWLICRAAVDWVRGRRGSAMSDATVAPTDPWRADD